MITIEDYDLPITVAQKIVTGRKPKDRDAWSRFMKAVALQDPQVVEEDALKTVDMFSLDEVEEITRHLIIFIEAQKNGD